MRKPPLVQRDPAAVVQERTAVGFGVRVELRGRVLRVVEHCVAQTQVGQGKVDAEGRVGEEEERIALAGRLAGPVMARESARRELEDSSLTEPHRSLAAIPIGRPSMRAASPALVSLGSPRARPTCDRRGVSATSETEKREFNVPQWRRRRVFGSACAASARTSLSRPVRRHGPRFWASRKGQRSRLRAKVPNVSEAHLKQSSRSE